MGESQKRVETSFNVTYHPSVARDDLSRIDTAWQHIILAAIEERLMTLPEHYGTPLRKGLKGCWKLRIGNYRVVFQISQRTVRIIAIIHRSTQYKGIEKRI
jgi:mRNA interferase RelE/StbE